MGARSTNTRKGLNARIDGRLLSYARNTFVRGGAGTNPATYLTLTWSDYLTNQYTLYDATNIFDSSTTTYGSDWNGVYNVDTSPVYRIEFTPPVPLKYNSLVRAYSVGAGGSPYSNTFYTDTGSGYGSGIAHIQNNWVTLLSGSGYLHKLKTTAVQNGTLINAIEIDGVILQNGVPFLNS